MGTRMHRGILREVSSSLLAGEEMQSDLEQTRAMIETSWDVWSTTAEILGLCSPRSTVSPVMMALALCDMWRADNAIFSNHLCVNDIGQDTLFLLAYCSVIETQGRLREIKDRARAYLQTERYSTLLIP